jgi:hypothetical protein
VSIILSSKTKNRKIFYYPTGIISLILLPILCICYLEYKNAFDKYGVIQIKWWTPELYADHSETALKEGHPNIPYTSTFLTGKDENDKSKLRKAQLEIHNWVKRKDTLTGFQFHFSDSAKYWTFIKVIDICKIEGAKYFTVGDNNIWVFYYNGENPHEEKIVLIECGTPFMSMVYIENPKLLFLKEKLMELLELNPKYLIPFLLFSLLLILTIKKIYKGQI